MKRLTYFNVSVSDGDFRSVVNAELNFRKINVDDVISITKEGWTVSVWYKDYTKER